MKLSPNDNADEDLLRKKYKEFISLYYKINKILRIFKKILMYMKREDISSFKIEEFKKDLK